jgi:hypothetical protein
MSFLSAMGSDCTLHNLNITGTLTLSNEPTTIIPENLDISNLNVTSDTSLNMLYVMDSTQLGGEIATNNAHFYTAFNANGVLPQPNTNTDAINCYGCICSNLSDADAEFNFVNTYEANASDVNAIAFSWYKTGFGTTPICGLTNNWLMKVNGLNTDNAEANTITALTSSSLGVATATELDVSGQSTLGNTSITGELLVNGQSVTGGVTQLYMENVIQNNVTVTLGSVVSGSMGIDNANNVSVYAVYPSVTYTSGSSSAVSVAQNLQPILISGQSMNSFVYTMNTTGSGSCTVSLSFLIVYM